MAPPRELTQREADVLTNMMGADSRRIDDLVDNVGEIKGAVHILKSDSDRIGQGVEQLQQSMTVLNRHAVLMETQRAEINTMVGKYDKLEARVRDIELDMPSLKDSRADVKKAVWIIVSAVMIAVLALVFRK